MMSHSRTPMIRLQEVPCSILDEKDINIYIYDIWWIKQTA
jgi:hypothetical protein